MTVQLPQAPFGSSSQEIHLANAPLVRALVQLRFPASTGLISDAQAVLRVAAALATSYPAYEEGLEAAFQIQPGASVISPANQVWTLRSASGKSSVRISPVALAYETSAYHSRVEMLQSLKEILAAALPVIRPASIERIGVRYSNLFPRDESLRRRVHASLLNVLDLRSGGVQVQRGASEAVYEVTPETTLAVRMALLLPGTTVDPSLPTPADGPGSFLLDLDSFSQTRHESFSEESLLENVEQLAEVAAGFFLWSLTPEGAEDFGAEAA